MRTCFAILVVLQLIAGIWTGEDFDPKQLVGKWQVDGWAIPFGKGVSLRAGRIVFRTEDMTMNDGTKWTYSLDPKASPMTITLKRTIDGKVQTREGLFEVTGDRLRICVAEIGQDRPENIGDQPKETPVLLCARIRP
jgi:uncharacterized protein (TIGR03067 family)